MGPTCGRRGERLGEHRAHGSCPSSAPAREPSPPLRPGARRRSGIPAPDVVFTFAEGTAPSRASRGQPVLVYFYPQGRHARLHQKRRGIRDAYDQFRSANVKVIGVSMQDAASHQAFSAKLKLPFSLAVDVDGSVATAFHVPIRDQRAARQSFLIDKDGKIAFVWSRVDPGPHAAAVLKQLKGP
ncbi:MAG: peroxiredoxin [Polyangiaceae bacterium]